MVVVAGVAPVCAWAQAPEQRPGQDPAPSGVQAAPARPTLVRTDDAGNLLRLDEPTEEAAIARLALSAAQREATSAIIAEHHKAIEAVVAARPGLAARALAVREAGAVNSDALMAARDLAAGDVGRALRDRDALRARLHRALSTPTDATAPDASAAGEGLGVTFDAMVAQYARAAAAQSSREAQAQGRRGQGGVMIMRENSRVMALDATSAVERRAGMVAKERLEELVAALQLPAEHHEAARRAIATHAALGAARTKADDRALLDAIVRHAPRERVEAFIRGVFAAP